MAREAARRQTGRAYLECADVALRLRKSATPDVGESPHDAARIRAHLKDLEENYRYRADRLLSPPIRNLPRVATIAKPYWRATRSHAYALFVLAARAADWGHLAGLYGERLAPGVRTAVMREADILCARAVRLSLPPRQRAAMFPGRKVGRPRKDAPSYDLEDTEEL